MHAERDRSPCVCLRRGVSAALLALLVSGCVYFNTFYNAQKYFGQAERARRKESEEAVLREAEGPVPLSARTQQLYETAARKASRVLEKYPTSDRVDDALFLLGKAFYWQQDYLSAARSFAELEAGFPHSEYLARARHWRALSLEAQGQHDSARVILQDLVASGDGRVSARAALRLGEMSLAAGDYVVAAEGFRAGLAGSPRGPVAAELWLRLGDALQSLEDSARYGEALAAYARVTEVGASAELEYRARLNTGRLLEAKGQDRQALAQYEALLNEGRFRAFEGRTRILIGRYHQERGDLAAALEQYQRVRDDFPQTPSAAMALYQTALLFLRDRGNEEQARRFLAEVTTEHSACEAADRARELARELDEADRLRQRVARADSLAAARTAAGAAAGAVADSAAAADGLAGQIDPSSGSDPAAVGQERRPEEATAEGPPPPAAEPGAVAPGGEEGVLDALLALAELYRDPERLAVPDSAIRYLTEVQRRYPESPEMPRVLYTIAWVHAELRRDEAAAQQALRALVDAFPSSEHADAARRELGLRVELPAAAAAAQEFARIERIRLQDPARVEDYLPLLDSLSARHAGTETAAQAAFLAAYTVENVQRDSAAAAQRYEQLARLHPGSRYARLVAQRDSLLRIDAVAKLERAIKSVGGRLPPGEAITTLAAQPDTMDSIAWALQHQAFGLRAQRRGDLQAARRSYERSLEERRQQPDVHYQLANVLLEQGYTADALAHYQQALALRPNMLEAQYRLIAAHVEAGQADSANHYLRTVMQRDLRNPQLERLREQHPELLQPQGGAELGLDELRELRLELPAENRGPYQEGAFGEMPLVRKAALPPPRGARQDTAWVILDLLVGKDGGVEDARVFAGPDELRDVAVAAARQYQFYPATDRRGAPVAAWVELELPFLPTGAPAAASEPRIGGDTGADAVPVDQGAAAAQEPEASTAHAAVDSLHEAPAAPAAGADARPAAPQEVEDLAHGEEP